MSDLAPKPRRPDSPAAVDGPVKPITTLLMVLTILALLYTLYFARDVLLPIILTTFLALLLRAPVRLLKRAGLPEGVGALIVTVALVLVLIVGLYQLAAPASEWIARGPELSQRFEGRLAELRQSLGQAQDAARQIEDIADGATGGDAPSVVVRGPGLTEQVLSGTRAVAANAVLMIGLLYFFLAGGGVLLHRLVNVVDDVDRRVKIATVVAAVQQNLSIYVLTVTTINVALGFAVGISMLIVGMPNPALWGAVATIMNYIPYVGAAVTTGLVGFVALVTFDSWVAVLVPPLIIIALNTVEGYFLTPMIVGRRLTLNPIAVFLSILIWGWLWGIPGGLLAVPILAAVKIVCDSLEPTKGIGALLGG